MRNVRCDSAARAVPLRAGSGAVPVDDRVLDLLERDPAGRYIEVALVQGLSGSGGTRPSYGSDFCRAAPVRGRRAEQSPARHRERRDGASGTVSDEAAAALRCTS